MDKYSFLNYFSDISAIPRSSGNETHIADYLCSFAQAHNLTCYRDELHNVIIYKPASTGYEQFQPIVLQCHTDMVCEKTIDSNHNFNTDGLALKINGDFICATDTTLGADNGIGIAYMLAILESNVQHPALECVFTVQEETTMNGAINIDSDKIHSNKIISFDNFSQDIFWIGSAASTEWKLMSDNEHLIENNNLIKVYISGFKGGHSGLDIGDETIGNPIKLGIELLNEKNCKIISIDGGTKVNVIPRECTFTVSTSQPIESLKSLIISDFELIKSKFPNSNIEISQAKSSNIDYSISNDVIVFLDKLATGALIRDNVGDVVVSLNLAKVETNQDKTKIIISIRSNKKELSQPIIEKVKQYIIQHNLFVESFDSFNGYEQDSDSELLRFFSQEYEQFFNKPAQLKAVQACLECEVFSEKIKDLQYIAMAPNIYNAHSPQEKMSLTSAKLMWEFVERFLPNLKFTATNQ